MIDWFNWLIWSSVYENIQATVGNRPKAQIETEYVFSTIFNKNIYKMFDAKTFYKIKNVILILMK